MSSVEKTPDLIPMPGKVYLRRLDQPATSSAFIIPDTAKEKGTEAVVIAIPSQPYYEYGILVPCPLNKGDRVVIGKYSGEHDWNGRKITIVRWDEILAVIAEEEDNSLPSAADLDHASEEVAIKSATQSGYNQSDRLVPRQ